MIPAIFVVQTEFAVSSRDICSKTFKVDEVWRMTYGKCLNSALANTSIQLYSLNSSNKLLVVF